MVLTVHPQHMKFPCPRACGLLHQVRSGLGGNVSVQDLTEERQIVGEALSS